MARLRESGVGNQGKDTLAESSSEKRIAALELEVEAAQTNLKLEKLRSENARERIVLLQTQIRVAYDVISNLARVQEDSLSTIRQIFQGDVDVNPENTNVLSISSESVATTNAPRITRSGNNFQKALNSNLLLPLEVETLRGPLSSPSHLGFLEGETGQEGEVPYIEDQSILLPLEVETLRGPLSSPSRLDFLEGETGQEGEVPYMEDQSIKCRVPVIVLDDIEALEVEDAEKDGAHEERNSAEKSDFGDANRKRRQILQGPERLVVSDAIRMFSSANPRKWVDACRDELKKTYKIKIGSSSLSTRKYREK